MPYVDVCAPPELLTFIFGTSPPSSAADSDADVGPAGSSTSAASGEESVGVDDAGVDDAAGPAPEGPDAAGESGSDSVSA
ncbi:hypothetical protein MARA_50230 [Mycolicibacterium arabiense]|uniref:Uncharacterized protein n=1 Tax=Mycolicibacterium arabiense TaxID=1286181 RepID=A0A7I7S6C6_9MYCO|nr:hypothetical protein MARA_50230 [Mycolicibacterium arabiense]